MTAASVGVRIPPALAIVPGRPLTVASPTIRIVFAPGDRALVAAGEAVLPGMPIAERTLDAALVDAGALRDVADAAPLQASQDPSVPPIEPRVERRRPPYPGKWWVGGEQRMGRLGRRYQSRRVGGNLLFETGGRWRGAAGERHEILEAPAAGIVREARNGVGITMVVSGSAIPGAVAAGDPARGWLDVPAYLEGDLQRAALDVAKAGAIVVAGSRMAAEALTRARAMGIRGVVTASIAHADLRDLAASDVRQRASLHALPPFAVLALDGYLRSTLASPTLALLRALSGREVAVVPDPPMLVFDAPDVAMPEFPPDWVRVRHGPLAGREGRWAGDAGVHRFRAGVHLEAAFVRFDDEPAVPVPVNDLERLI